MLVRLRVSDCGAGSGILELVNDETENFVGKPEIKECFGEYGCRFGPEDHDPKECFTCTLATHCYQMTVADAVTSTAANLSLIVDSLVANGTLKEVEDPDGPKGRKA